MSFKRMYALFLLGMMLSIAGCSDPDREKQLVEIFESASEDVIAISFPASNETTVSINSQVLVTLQGLRSNGVDLIPLTQNVTWSLSAGAISTIDQNGLLITGATAESITVTATFGIFSESLNIRVSAAKFDQVVQLDASGFNIDMCRSQTLKPVGRYVDVDNNNVEELRSVDSTIINTIEWIILNEDKTPSSRAYIETINNQAVLHTLASGELLIQAKAQSVFTGSEVTSVEFEQTVGSALSSVKLCLSSDTNLSSCSVTSASVEKDSAISFISVGNYPATDGSNLFENITRNSQWGIDNTANASSVFASNRQQIDVTGNVENTTANLSVACGNIEQSLAVIDDITQGVNFTIPVSCGTNTACSVAVSTINIDELSVLSFEVTANRLQLTDNVSLPLDSAPLEIRLIVNANFSNGSQSNVTTDSELDYTVVAINGQDVIEEKAGSKGTFTVLGAGTARIEIDYRNETFIALIQVPL